MSEPRPKRDRVADAVTRLERAVDDLVAVAGDRAADYVERATEHLHGEAPRHHARDGRRRRRRDYRYRYSYGYGFWLPGRARAWSASRSSREPAWLWSDRPRSRKLCRDAKDGKILGVCAGLARYYGLETWVVRCLAVIALIFFNWVAFVSYLVAAFILDASSKEDEHHAAGSDSRASDDVAPPPPHRQAPSPGRELRTVNADLDEVELRLRRIESHVTSGQYELQRELAKIDRTP